MPKFIVGARLHDYGKGSPDELFGRVAADGFAAVQLAYKKCVPTVRSYADVTDALVAETVAAEKAHNIQVAVLGTYVELAINDESRLKNAADFKSQLAVCKALGAGCIGTETTSMEKQPAGTTREEAQELLCRSLADILPAAEALGVTVAVGPLYARLTHTYPDLTVELLLYQAAIAAGTPQLLEHAALHWVAVDELEQYAFCPADAPILERLRAEGLPPEFSPAP